MTQIKTILLLSITAFMLSACFNSDDKVTGANTVVVTVPCLPVENNCTILLENNVKLRLQFKATPSYQRLLPVAIEASDSGLENASITMIIDGEKMPSKEMKASEDKKVWEAQLLPFADVTNDNIKVSLAVTHKTVRYSVVIPVKY